jgi:hypothetical protein
VTAAAVILVADSVGLEPHWQLATMSDAWGTATQMLGWYRDQVEDPMAVRVEIENAVGAVVDSAEWIADWA